MELINIDGLEMNDGMTRSILEGTFEFTPAPKKLNWLGSPLADGQALAGGDEDHYDNAEMTFKLRILNQATPDAARQELHLVTQKLQEARRTMGGLPVSWTPSGTSNSYTLYVLDGAYDEVSLNRADGVTPISPQVVLYLYCRPFLYLSEQVQPLGWSDHFVWDGITGDRWRFDAGSGTVSVPGGLSTSLLTESSTAAKRLYVPWQTADATFYMRVRVGATVGTGEVQVMHKRLSSSSYAYVGIVGGSGLRIATSSGTLTTTSQTITANTWYWINAVFDGDDVTANLYDDSVDPRTEDATPLASATTSLASTWGSGVRGSPGIRWTPGSANDWYIDVITIRGMSDVKSSEPLVDFELPNVPGHVPAEGRLVVTDKSSNNQSHVEWGLEQRSYDLSTVAPLLIDSDSLVVSGYAGTQSTASGAFDPDATGNNCITSGGLSTVTPVAICSTGSQQHTGNFKVKARVTGDVGVVFRLAWRIGDGPYARNAYSLGIVGANHWQEVDLGNIIVPEAVIGNQSWEGHVEAYSPITGNGTLSLNYLELIPAEKYGVARAPLQPIVATTFNERDRFAQGAGGALTGKTLDTGDAWTTSSPGGTGDFTINNIIHCAQRVVVSDTAINSGRYAVAGSTNYGATQVQIDTLTGDTGSATDLTDAIRLGVFARYTDSNNWLMASLQTVSVDTKPGVGANFVTTLKLQVYKRVAGTQTVLKTFQTSYHPTRNLTLILSVDAGGVWQAYVYPKGTKQPSKPQISGYDSVLTTTLATGKVGFYDGYTLATPAITRIYDNFIAFASTPDVVIHADKALEIRADRTERQAATGGNYGKVPQYQGSRFFIPQEGDAERVSRMAVKGRRVNVDEGLPDDNIQDSLLAAVYARPRFLIPAKELSA